MTEKPTEKQALTLRAGLRMAAIIILGLVIGAAIVTGALATFTQIYMDVEWH
jgi:hypothetical protein